MSKRKPLTLETLEFHAEHLNSIISGSVEVITPQQAKESLENTRFKNRKLKKVAIQKYTEDLIEGRWCVNGEPIIYDRDGNLVNGFHRLTALSSLEIPGALFFVVRGIAPEAVKTIDCGVVRSIKDRMDIENNHTIKYASVASAAVNIRYNLVKGATLKKTVYGRGLDFSVKYSLSDPKKLEIFAKESEAINWAVSLSGKVFKKNSAVKLKSITRPTIAGLSLYLLTVQREDLGMIASFFNQLYGNEPDCGVTNTLRKKLNNDLSPDQLYYYICTAWSYFKKGRTEVSRFPKYEGKPI